MGAPQVIYLVLLGFGIGVALAEHGKPKTGKHNAWTTIIASMLALMLLRWGGFFGGAA